MNSLDKYNEAYHAGILSDSTDEYILSLEKEIADYEAKIVSLTESINGRNQKIAGWRTTKTTASTSYKKTLSSYISAEQGKITATRAEISRIKEIIKSLKSRLSEVKKYKPASYYINQGVKESGEYYGDLIDTQETSFDIWFAQNGQNTSMDSVASKKRESVNEQIKSQTAYVKDLTNAYEKMLEIYGESASESVNLLEILKEEELALENLKKSYSGVYSAVKEALSLKKDKISLDITNEKLKNNLWDETEGKEAEDYERRAYDISSYNNQLEEQGKILTETANAYKEMANLYGINADESKALENQLLSECVAYEKLKNKISELYQVREYDRKETEDIIYSLEDYLKTNKEFLLSQGYSEEEIYQVAKKATGYEKFIDYFYNKPEEKSLISADNLISDILIEILKDKFSDLPESFLDKTDLDFSVFEDIFSNFDSALHSIGGVLDFFEIFSLMKDLNVSSSGNTYSSVYNLYTSGNSSVADQIYDVKKFDFLKKARGLL